MSEIETKIFGINKELALNRLRQCAREKDIDDPEMIFKGRLTAVYYGDGSGSRSVIRLRTEEQENKVRNILTVKVPEESSHPNIKKCAEENLVIIDLSQADRMIRLLGYIHDHSVIKFRETWLFNGARFEFDHIENGKEWLEIEAADTKHLIEAIECLGYTLDQCSDKTTEEISHDEDTKEGKH
jgi:adenylate cyclase class IV